MKIKDKAPFILILFSILIPFMTVSCQKKDASGKEKVTVVVKNGSSSPLKEYPPAPELKAPFADQGSVSLSELLREMKKVVRTTAAIPHKKEEFKEFASRHNLEPTDALYYDYIKSTMIFEVSRTGGIWNLFWDITNQEPQSDKIWSQWKNVRGSDVEKKVTAIAECDEVSALYAFLLRKLGTGSTGLFWPTSNHTVAVWKLKDKEGKDVRIVVPTTQIFLDSKQKFDTNGFDPWIQEAIYDYTRDDVGDDYTIPGELAHFMILQMKKYSGATGETLNEFVGLRDAVFLKQITRKKAVEYAKRFKEYYKQNGRPKEDVWAAEYFIKDYSKSSD